MKIQKVGLLALSFLAGGALAAFADTAYQVDIEPTNATARVWDLYRLPRLVATTGITNSQDNTDIGLDASGKIIGSGYVAYYFASVAPAFSPPFVGYAVDVKGKVSKGAKTSMTIKGPGGQVNGDGTGEPGSISAKFTGEPGVNPLAPTEPTILGNVKATLKGQTPDGEKTTKVDATAYIPDSYTWLFELEDLGVLQDNDKGKQQLFMPEATGKGTIKTKTDPNTYKGSLKGIGWEKGLKVNISGDMGPATNSVTIGTNPPSTVVFSAPLNAEISGKTHGQDFSGSASRLQGTIDDIDPIE